jgi:hypothetical protein
MATQMRSPMSCCELSAMHGVVDDGYTNAFTHELLRAVCDAWGG